MHCTRHRVFLATLIVAAKFLNDSSPKNKHWAKYAALFSLAEVTLMEKQLLYLLDYDINMTEDELLLHFRPFLSLPQYMPSPPPQPWIPTRAAAPQTPRTIRTMPSLESCASSPADSASPVTPGNNVALTPEAMLPTPSPSPLRRGAQQYGPSLQAKAGYEPRRTSPLSSSDEEAEPRSASDPQARRRMARDNIGNLQAAAQQAARRGSAAVHAQHTEIQAKQQQEAPSAQLNLPFTSNELAYARREAIGGGQSAMRSKPSSTNILASVRGYFKGMNTTRDPSFSTTDEGITIVS